MNKKNKYERDIRTKRVLGSECDYFEYKIKPIDKNKKTNIYIVLHMHIIMSIKKEEINKLYKKLKIYSEIDREKFKNNPDSKIVNEPRIILKIEQRGC